MVLAAFVVDAVPAEDALEEVEATTTMGLEVECEEIPVMMEDETTGVLEDETMEVLEEAELGCMVVELLWTVYWHC